MDCGRIYSEAKHEIETHTSSCMAHADKSDQESSVNQVANANHGCVAVWYFFSVTFSPFFRFSTWFLQTWLETFGHLIKSTPYCGCKHGWKYVSVWLKNIQFLLPETGSKMSCCPVKKVLQFQAYKCWRLTRKWAHKHVMWTWCLIVYLNKSLQESELPTCYSATEQFLLLVQGTEPGLSQEKNSQDV